MPLAEICAAAKARGLKRGLSAATVNRNLGFVGQLLKQARSEGLQLDPLLDTRDLREIDQEDEQDKVQPFSRQDICSIFQGPIWQGSASSTRRTKAGKHLFKDGLYWIPIIAAYTGARREEIAGLSCSDIVQEDDIGHSAWKTPTFGGSRTVRPGARCPCTIT